MENLIEAIKLKNKPNLIWDFDGTICHLNIPWHKGLNDINAAFIAVDEELFNNNKYKNVTELINLYSLTYGKDVKSMLDEVTIKFEKNNLNNFNQIDTVVDFIKSTTDNFEHYIWSSNSLVTINNILNQLNIKECFKTIVAFDSVGLVKPYPDGFYIISKNNLYNRDQYLMIGDTHEDLKAAINSGIDFLKIDNYNK